MTAPMARGEFTRSHDCGWSGTYDLEGIADYQLRRHSCEKARRLAARRARGKARMDAIDRNPKPCLHKKANHQHGTYACYTLDACRCEPCSEASSQYDVDLRRSKAYGRYDTWTDPEPARRHIRALMAQGMGLKQIIAVGGSNSGQLWKLLYGTKRPDGSRTPTKRIRKDVAERLLAVELDLADGAYVPVLPSARRLRALVALGWSQARLAERLGHASSQMVNGWVNEARDQVFVANAKAIAALYEELSMTPPPETTHRERISVSRARSYARARGWLPPLAIDEELLDDDFEGGQIVLEVEGDDLDDVAIERRMAGDKSVQLTQAEKVELRRRWFDRGGSQAELERVCGMAAITRMQKAS